MFGTTRVKDSQLELLTAEIENLSTQIAKLKGERKAARDYKDLMAEKYRLMEEIEDLKITKGRKTEEHEREMREVRHMVGLERKKQEFEYDQKEADLENIKTETVLEVQQENLEKDQARFDKEMKFREERFTEEVAYLKDIMGQILERLPEVSVSGKLKAVGNDGAD